MTSASAATRKARPFHVPRTRGEADGLCRTRHCRSAGARNADHGVSAQTTGIAACDDVLKKFEACLASRIPAAQKTTFQSQLDQMRKDFSDAAKNPSAKAALEGACKQSAHTGTILTCE